MLPVDKLDSNSINKLIPKETQEKMRKEVIFQLMYSVISKYILLFKARSF
jgi:hypothetical protein